jgi:D-alanyl-D-alanine-carboxypeptidase/D-alanyl-D-alanine-endopeptidase
LLTACRFQPHRAFVPMAGLVLMLALGCDSPTSSEPATLTEAIDDLAEQYVKVGAMVGVVRGSETLVLSYGTKRYGADDPPDRHSIFEIGSITKSFTTTLLARWVLDGTLDPEERVQSYLPADRITLPTWGGEEITFIQLATHRSGLPRVVQESDYPKPPGYDPHNQYAEYTTEHIYDYLTNYVTLLSAPGTVWLYSNTGMGLLGHVLGLIGGTSYDTLVTRDVFDVLGMESTSLDLTEAQLANLAVGHSESRALRPNFTAQDIYQGAGFIKTSLDDMLVYLKAHMGLIATPLNDAMEHTREPRFHVEGWGDSGLDWYTKGLPDGQVVTYKGGRTGGYGAYMGINEATSTGVVVLMNHSESAIAQLFGQDVLMAAARH